MTGPEHFTAGGEFIEPRRGVAHQPGWENKPLECASGYGAAAELLDHSEYALGAGKRAADVLPGRQEPAECDRIDRLGLLSQRGEGPAPQQPEDLGITPFAPGPPRRELTVDDPAGGREPAQRVGHDRDAQPQPPGHIGCPEWCVGAGKARDEVAKD